MAPPRKKAKRQTLADTIFSEEDWAKLTKGRRPIWPKKTTTGVVELYICPWGDDAESADEKRWGRSVSILTILVDVEKDAMLQVMKRLEHELRIPVEHWSLCWEHYVLTPQQLARDCSTFSKQEPTVYWCGAADVDEYLKSHPAPMSWRLQPPRDIPDGSTWKDRTIAHFNLNDPFPEQHSEAIWRAYFEERSSYELHQVSSGSTNDLDGDEQFEAPFKEVIRSRALKYLLDDAQKDSDKETAHRLNDGILHVYHSGGEDGDGDGDFRSANLFVRIYPLHTLTAVDVGILYHCRSRWESIEYFCKMAYRYRPPTSKPLGVTREIKGKDWKTIFDGHAGDTRGRHNRQSWPAKAPMTKQGVKELSAAILGPRPKRRSETVHRVLAMQVLMSALTVDVNLGSKKADRPPQPHIAWTIGRRVGWFDAKLRVACGVGNAEDEKMKADFSDYEMYGTESEDEDEDDEDDGEFDSDDDIYRSY